MGTVQRAFKYSSRKDAQQLPDSTLEVFLSTGVRSLDFLLGGGLPRGQISEIVGALSSGKTGLLFSILAQAVSRGEKVVYIDVFDSFDPLYAQAAGMNCNNLLWIRCRDLPGKVRLDKALKAMDILARSEGFDVLALDLAPVFSPDAEDPAGRIPFNVWFRLKRLIEGKKTSILLLSRHACSGSASALVLGIDRHRVRWFFPSTVDQQNSLRRIGLFRGIYSDIRLLRGKRHGHVQIYSGI